ncbi:uncharacterized protein [Coffea arabica]|uniref:Uncharacterized protein n=1 Tax=Coffea arabica TaxID=13443 RepID=A0ABM4W1X0_COFAR
MGKKKAVKKTKELSVAIAESSSLDAEGQQQPLTPRKRGRPRKIIAEKTEVEEVKEEEKTAQEEEAHDVEGGDSKKVKTSDEKEKGQPSKMKEDATTTTMTTAAAAASSSSKKQLSAPRSRARRKSSGFSLPCAEVC